MSVGGNVMELARYYLKDAVSCNRITDRRGFHARHLIAKGKGDFSTSDYERIFNGESG